MESEIKMQIEPVVTDLTEEMVAELEEMRDFVKMHVPDESMDFFETVEGKLFMVQEILDLKLYPKESEWIHVALGVALGDALALALKAQWAVVTDDYGMSVSLVSTHGDDTAFLFPLTMVSKRVARGEDIDVAEIFTGILEYAEKQLNLC
ncbi:MAG: DUF3806 domain-containing protein [Clostridiales bacterium]|nr:DUF3806 domain-containing protein [Clostridiales bacterium]MDR2749407.1 DUF3806 domain-containing protein [Clostridiales bacterium]